MGSSVIKRKEPSSKRDGEVFEGEIKKTEFCLVEKRGLVEGFSTYRGETWEE